MRNVVVVCLFLLTTSAVQSWNFETLTRRQALAWSGSICCGAPATLAFAAAPPKLTPDAYNSPTSRPQAGRGYFPTITPPFSTRATFRYDLGNDMYAFEQLLTLQNVTATIRMTVVRNKRNELFVHSPLYPTKELRSLLDELGVVKWIVLPVNALEHKAPMKSFVSNYPDASVYIVPGQYSVFGSMKNMGYEYDGILDGNEAFPDADFAYQTLNIDIPGNAGPVTEVAFLHKPTSTLMLTDALVFIPKTLLTPEIFQTYFDSIDEDYFYERTVLQAVFLPLRYENGRYPGFDAISDRLVRAPILRGFNDARGRDATVRWIDKICTWNFDKIVSSHFVSPIAATPTDVHDAFGYLYGESNALLPKIACVDWETLDNLNDLIAKNKLGAPATFDYKKDCL